MKKRVLGFISTGLLLTAFLVVAVPVWAQGVDDRIQALEQELGRLKAEQMELKKEATEAAAALPTFTYRTGFLGITAADKSWQISFSHEFHVHMYNHMDGNDSDGFTTGDIFLRRNRPFIYYCWDNCLYEIGWGLDMDDGDIASSQHARFMFNLDKINPYLPNIEISDRGNEQVSYVQRSSSSSARTELTRDLLNDGAYDTLSHAGIGIGYPDLKVGPGQYMLWAEYRIGSGLSQNTNSDTDRKQFFLKAGAAPFSEMKNKWLRGLKFGLGWVRGSLDKRSSVAGRLALRTDDRIGRIRVFDTQAVQTRFCETNISGDCVERGTFNNMGGGDHYALFPGLEWRIGPYLFRTEMAYSYYENKGGRAALNGNSIDGFAWSLQHELFLWSPKGFLTGSSRTPNSVLVGWSFARSDMDCGAGADCLPGSGSTSRNHLVQRQLDLWYFLRPGLNIGMWWNWWSTPTMPTTLQRDVGCVNDRNNERVGKSCDWHTVNLGLRANF